MNIEIYHKGALYSAKYTITYNLDTGSEIHRIELIYHTMSLVDTGHSLEEALEKVKSTLNIVHRV